MNNKNIADLADYLHELVRFRNAEQIQKEEFNCFTETDAKSYQSRTDKIYNLACKFDEKHDDHCEIGHVMTLDEAIEHAKNVAESDVCTSCAAEHKQLADWLSELKDIKNKYAYLAADFDNYRKRTLKAEQTARDKAEEDTTLHFLRVYDDLERLIANLKNNDVGFNIVVKALEQMLNDHGFEKIDCKCGDKFDVNTMEAISTRSISENEKCSLDDVVDIYQSGWMHNGKMIRPTKVVVGK